VKVLIVRLGAIGDIVHTVPVAAALRRAHPEATIDWLVERRHEGVVALFQVTDRVIPIEPAGSWLETVKTVRMLRAAHYDVVLDVQGLLKSAVLARLAGGVRTIGFARSWLREPAAERFYTEVVEATGAVHVIERNLWLLRALGLEGAHIETPLLPLTAPVADDVVAAEGSRYGIVNPGAGWPNKQWPPERWGQVVAEIQKRHGFPWIVVWGPGEESLARAVEEASDGVAMLAPPTTLDDLVALIERATIMLAGDTGPLHLASAARTPVVGVYGPTDPARNGPWSREDVCVSRFAACECHHKRRCSAASWCLESVSVEEMVDAVERRLAMVEKR
jgi:lipopolysaccharide heptosyltransferase I